MPSAQSSTRTPTIPLRNGMDSSTLNLIFGNLLQSIDDFRRRQPASRRIGDELDELFDYQPNISDSDASDGDYGATPSKPRVKKSSSRVLDLGRVLQAPRAAQYSTSTIYNMVKDDLIDLEPEYQRGVVWTADKQSAVIESIMRHYYVPPILLSVQGKSSDDGDTLYVCIDGKQRVSSICNFIGNEIPVREPSTGRKFWFKENLAAGQTLALSPAQRRKFENEQMTIVIFEGLTEESERDMFSRVQMGVTLSSAEKLGAHLGAWPDFIRQMVKRFIDPTPSLVHDNDGNSMLMVSRGRDYLYIAQMALLILHADNPLYVPSAHTIDTFLKQHAKAQPPNHLRQSMQKALERYVALANHKRYGACIKPETKLNTLGRPLQKPLSPTEFVYIAFLIYSFPDATVAQLFRLVQGLKEEVRSQYKDVLFNSRVAGTIRHYIKHARVSPDPEPHTNDRSPRHKRTHHHVAADSDDDVPVASRRRANGGLEINPDAGLFRGSNGEISSRNPLTNMSPAPFRR